MRCVVCAMAKKENPYINEWCHHHLNLGFEHIYVYDNNDLDYPDVRNCISDDIKDKVTFFDVRGLHGDSMYQGKVTEFYRTFNNSFDWCAFIDLDEFIVLNKWKTINELVNDPLFKDVDIITFPWKIFDDNNLIERDISIPLMQSFTRPYHNQTVLLQHKEMIRGNNKHFIKKGCHGTFYKDYFPVRMSVDGKYSKLWIQASEHTKNAWLNHYRTKSLSEFISQKYMGTDFTGVDKRYATLNYYFMTNDKTTEKIDWLKKKGIIK